MFAETVIGRDREVARLRAGLAALRAGRGGVLAVTGEPGIGKTRLLGELAGLAEASGLLALSGRAAELERDVPFAALADALDDFVAARPPRDLADLADDLVGVLPCLGVPPPGGDARLRAHRALRTLLGRLGSERPLVLMLDDLQWADPGTIRAVAHLVRRPATPAILLVLALRPAQVPPELRVLLDGALRDGRLDRLDLAPLSRAEADALAGAPVDDAVWRDAGGNPFYLLELGRTAGRARRPGGEPDLGVPPRVAAALAGEIAAVDGPLRGLLDGAAVAGDPFEIEVAAAAAGLDEDAALEALDGLLERDLVRSTGAPRRFRFRHPIVRRAVATVAGEGWRIAAHARIDELLAARGAPASARAHHLARSAAHGDAAAADVLTAAAAETSPREPATAAVWLRRAIEILPADADPARRVGLLVQQAMAEGTAGMGQEARATLDEVLGILPPGLPDRVRLAAFAALLDTLMGRPDRATALLEGELAALPSPGAPGTATLTLELGKVDSTLGRFDAAAGWWERSVGAARDEGDPVLLAAALGALASSEIGRGRLERALALLDEASPLLDACSDAALASRLDAAIWLARPLQAVGRTDDALRHLERCVTVSEATGQAHMVPMARLLEAMILLERGRLAELRAVGDALAELGLLTGNPQLVAMAAPFQIAARTGLGQVEDALRLGEESLRLARPFGPLIATGTAHFLAEALLERGEADRAVEVVLATAGGPDLPGMEVSFAPAVYLMLTRAEVARRRVEAAAGWADRAAEVVARAPVPYRVAEARTAAALVALAGGDPATAAMRGQEAVDAADGAGAPLAGARARVVVGRALAATGERDRAIEVLRQAAAAAESCGAVSLRDEAQRELRRLGQRAGRPGGPGGGALSDREREVAGLVAEGRTNREIAAVLHLSERTVEAHMRRIFAKLGVRTRAAVAAEVARSADRAPGTRTAS
ncbi:MAG: AAA family ATPase [Thermoleophilia bacterium]|nr:AAA family ATPase [Thermoleophilia bacterium]